MTIPLGIYEHYKGQQYEVVGVAHHSETREALVVYKMLYATADFPHGSLWVRPYSMFTEHITVDGQSVPRFRYLKPSV